MDKRRPRVVRGGSSECIYRLTRRGWDGLWNNDLAVSPRLPSVELTDRSAGHAAGDRLLRDLAVAWQSTLRAGDTVARIGGDEFGVLLSNTSAEQAQAILTRTSNNPVGAWSSGLRQWQPPKTGALLTRRADMALCDAKRLLADTPPDSPSAQLGIRRSWLIALDVHATARSPA